jgi:hypothetical protein
MPLEPPGNLEKGGGSGFGIDQKIHLKLGLEMLRRAFAYAD